MKPRVSVIITAYNHEDYIAESLYSVLNQTYDNFEIIVINDGSSDSTGQIIEGIKNQYPHKIRFINNKKNTRPKIAGNQGFEVAKGEFIAFNDGDDFWEPTKLEKQISIFDKDKSGSLGLVYTYGRNLNLNSERKVNLIWSEDPKKDLFKQLFYGAFFFKISMMVRAEIIQTTGGYNEKFPMCTDYELMLRIAALGTKFDRVPEVLVNHRIHSRNDTGNRGKSMLNTKEMIVDFSNRHKELIEEKKLNVSHRLAICDLLIAKFFITSERYIEARKIYLNILFNQPTAIFFSKSNVLFFLISLCPIFLIDFLKKYIFVKSIFLAE